MTLPSITERIYDNGMLGLFSDSVVALLLYRHPETVCARISPAKDDIVVGRVVAVQPLRGTVDIEVAKGGNLCDISRAKFYRVRASTVTSICDAQDLD